MILTTHSRRLTEGITGHGKEVPVHDSYRKSQQDIIHRNGNATTCAENKRQHLDDPELNRQ
jgi:hypothetical protein